MKIIYSFNKKGFEADYWEREIAAASTAEHQFIPFNHDSYLDVNLYRRGQLLDNLYYQEHPGLRRMYADFERKLLESRADVLLVDTCPPYHPEFLRRLDAYKVLRTSDGPMTAYDRDFAYVHAYDHVLYHSPAYSRDMTMQEKLHYIGAKRADFWPLALFDAMHDTRATEETILRHERDVDIIFIGALHPNKMPLLATVRKAFGKRFRMHGLAGWKKNMYFNAKFGCPGWVMPIDFREYVGLYQRSKIGINVHNRGKYTVGSYRLFDLPGNGVMQISDGEEHLSSYFKVPTEIEQYGAADDLIDKLKFYLENDRQREAVALAGFRRVRKEYRFRSSAAQAVALIGRGMQSAL